MSDADNARRFAADRRGVYEVWYTTWNDPKTGQGFWLRFIIEAPTHEPPRGELWFARFDPHDSTRTFGIHKRFPAADFSTGDHPFRLSIDTALMSDSSSRGALAGDGHSVAWDLHWESAGLAVRFMSDALYARGGLSSTLVHAPNAAVPMTGTLVIDGETITFDRTLITQSHVWGTKHSLAWTWAHCHDFEGAPGAMIEVLAGKLQRGAVTLPTMTGVVLVLDGEVHRLNQLRHLVGNRATFKPGKVTFAAASLTMRVEGAFTCSPDKMVNCPYFDPDGQDLWCANTEIADATVTVYRRSGLTWREDRRLVSRGHAHFEVGSRERDPVVTTPHVMLS